MIFVIVHLKLQQNSEEIAHVVWIGVDQNVVNSFIFDLTQNHSLMKKHIIVMVLYKIYDKYSPVIARISLPDVHFDIL